MFWNVFVCILSTKNTSFLLQNIRHILNTRWHHTCDMLVTSASKNDNFRSCILNQRTKIYLELWHSCTLNKKTNIKNGLTILSNCSKCLFSGPDEIQLNELKTQCLSKPVRDILRRYIACVTQLCFHVYRHYWRQKKKVQHQIKHFSIHSCLKVWFFFPQNNERRL